MLTLLVFIILTAGPLMLDMGSRQAGVERLARSVAWTCIYVASSLVFAAFLSWHQGQDQAMLFLSAYSIEKAMSVDNLMIFGAVFAYFGVKREHQHRVLHYGIVGSAILRMFFIGIGLSSFYVFGRLMDIAFGIFVVWTGVKVLRTGGDDTDIDHDRRWYIRCSRYFLPTSTVMNGKFFNRQGWLIGGSLAATPLLFCLISMEFTDLAFAFDSMPAVVGLTRDPMLAYTATMFAVIGLRSMYFVLDSLRRYTASLGFAVSCVLVFVGASMLLRGLLGLEIKLPYTLGVILSLLLYGVLSSLRERRTEAA